MRRPLIAACAAIALTACTTPTIYGPQTGPAGAGFADYRIETGRYRVTFTGGPGAPVNQVADYALLRAAEVSLRDGYDWFRVVERRDARVAPASRSSLSVGTGSGSWGRRGGVGVGLGTSFDLSGGPAWMRSLEILAGKGPLPKERDVYDARDIVRVVGRGEPVTPPARP